MSGVGVIQPARTSNGERTGGSEERRRRSQSDREQETVLLRSMERDGGSEFGGRESRGGHFNGGQMRERFRD